jgi:hypothetical protein
VRRRRSGILTLCRTICADRSFANFVCARAEGSGQLLTGQKSDRVFSRYDIVD